MTTTGGGVPQFASLYVGDLHPDVTEAILYEIFNSVGPVGSIRICRDTITKKSLGYGYINFHSVSDAERALDTLNYSNIKGRACRIMWSQRDPTLRKSGVGNIFVKNLDLNIDNKALYDTFSLFGNILSCKVACDVSGRSRGYGFVHYETEEAAKQAIERVNGMQIGDKTVEVHAFVKRHERDGGVANFTNLYVKGLPASSDEASLTALFEPFGPIKSSVVMQDKLGRKFAFVNYEEPESAQKAVAELSGKDVRTEEQKAATKEDEPPENYLLYVGRAQTKAERQREFREKSGQAEASGVNLYVKNLDESVNDASLRELFEPFGAVTSCIAMKDDQDKCKGFGFVCFSSPDEATKAVTEMHLKVVKGKPLYVGLAERKAQREERLRQRYAMGKGMGKEGKGGKGMMGGPMGGCMGGMGGGPMMGMMGKGGMMPPMMMGQKGGMMGPGGKGPMMGGPQMMGMMPGKGGPGAMPPMMGMMAGKGGMPTMPMGPMMRPMMPPMMQGGPGAMRPLAPQQPLPPQPSMGGQLTAATLAAAAPNVQKQMLGERLFPAISRFQPELAGKITGMMLEMDNSELLILLESDSALKAKVDEAMQVLQGSSRN